MKGGKKGGKESGEEWKGRRSTTQSSGQPFSKVWDGRKGRENLQFRVRGSQEFHNLLNQEASKVYPREAGLGGGYGIEYGSRADIVCCLWFPVLFLFARLFFTKPREKVRKEHVSFIEDGLNVIRNRVDQGHLHKN